MLLQQSLLKLVASLPAVQVQNRLMACTDRDLALALRGLPTEESEDLLKMISPSKADRVREEIRLQERRRVEDRYIVVALRSIVLSLESNKYVAGQRSYLRPRKPRYER